MCIQTVTSTGLVAPVAQRTLFAVQIGLITCVFWLLIMTGLVGMPFIPSISLMGLY